MVGGPADLRRLQQQHLPAFANRPAAAAASALLPLFQQPLPPARRCGTAPSRGTSPGCSQTPRTQEPTSRAGRPSGMTRHSCCRCGAAGRVWRANWVGFAELDRAGGRKAGRHPGRMGSRLPKAGRLAGGRDHPLSGEDWEGRLPARAASGLGFVRHDAACCRRSAQRP